MKIIITVTEEDIKQAEAYEAEQRDAAFVEQFDREDPIVPFVIVFEDAPTEEDQDVTG